MKRGFEYWDCISLLLIAILYFLTSKGVLPLFLYSVVSIIVTFAIVPGKLFFIWKKIFQEGQRFLIMYYLTLLLLYQCHSQFYI